MMNDLPFRIINIILSYKKIIIKNYLNIYYYFKSYLPLKTNKNDFFYILLIIHIQWINHLFKS
jgi:hypothetical protein